MLHPTSAAPPTDAARLYTATLFSPPTVKLITSRLVTTIQNIQGGRLTCIANTETALHTENAPCAACHSNGHAAAAPRAGATSQSSMHSNPLALSRILVLSRSSCSADARLSYQPTKRPAAVLRRAMTHTHANCSRTHTATDPACSILLSTPMQGALKTQTGRSCPTEDTK